MGPRSRLQLVLTAVGSLTSVPGIRHVNQMAERAKPRGTKSKKKLYIPPCLYNPKAKGCANYEMQLLAAQKEIDKCTYKNGVWDSSPTCEAIEQEEIQSEIESTPCNGENYGECNPDLTPQGGGTNLAGVISDVASGASLFVPEDATFAGWLVNFISYFFALL